MDGISAEIEKLNNINIGKFRELSDQIIVRSDQIKDHYFGDLDLILDQLFRE